MVAAPSTTELHAYRHKAERNAIERLLQALIREQLLTVTINEGGLLIPLEKGKGRIHANEVSCSALGYYRFDGEIQWITDLDIKLITQVQQLLDIIKPYLDPSPDHNPWQQFTDEIHNHVQNFSLSLWVRDYHRQLIQSKTSADTHRYLCEWLENESLFPNKTLFFEHWVTHGHPYHPCSKTKLGLSIDEVIHYSPEFGHETKILIAAIHRDHLHIEGIPPSEFYCEWFFDYFSESIASWNHYLNNCSLDPKLFVPIPIHPWQATHVINDRFHDLLERKKLFIFKDLQISTYPTLSFRTMMGAGNLYAPHMKLPVAVHTTSALRTVSPASCENGPKLSQVLHDILLKENHFGNRLRVMFEQFGIYVKGYDDSQAKHLSAIFRDNANLHLSPDELGIVVNALFETSPTSKQPIFIELMSLANALTVSSALQYFRNYTRIVLESYLDLYLLYGIALEAHQQNTLAVFHTGKPVATIARDFGGLRVHLPTLQSCGYSINPYPGSATFRSDKNEVRNKLLHTTYQYHFGEWIYHLSEYFKIPETHFWKIVREETETRFHALKKRLPSEIWNEEYEAILQRDWVLKALLRMRLNNLSHDYIYIPLKNPLKA